MIATAMVEVRSEIASAAVEVAEWLRLVVILDSEIAGGPDEDDVGTMVIAFV